MLGSFESGDVAIFDRYCFSYMMLALFGQRGVHVCTRIHAGRHVDFRQGKRLGDYDRLVTWNRPQRPTWMSVELYATIPETLELRMLQYSLVGRGRRSRTITVVTTLTDPVEYPKEEIAELYGHGRRTFGPQKTMRKRTLNMDHFRYKSPAMVEREFWATLLGYNLVRKVMCEAATFAGLLPRRLSFTRTCTHLLETWVLWSLFGVRAESLSCVLGYWSDLTIPDRPGRLSLA